MTVPALAVPLRTQLAAGTRFVASFGIAKATAFAGPLVLARFAAPAEYGAIELALSIGLLGAVVGSLGMPLAVPQLFLALGRRRIEDLLAFQTLAVVVAGALGGLVLWHAAARGAVLLGAVLAGLFAAQLALSTYCRVRQLRVWSGWADNLCMILVPALALGVLVTTGGIALGSLSLVGEGGLLLVGAGALVVFVRFRRPGFGAAYRDAVGRGGIMMVNALLLFFVTGSLRLFIGRYLPLEDVATYSLCARICLVLVLLHQIAATGLFAQIYRLPIERCDRWFAACLGGLLALALLLVAGGVAVMDRITWGGLDMTALRGLFPIVCVQTVLWIVSAWLELPINREGLAGRSAVLLGLLIAGFVAGLAGLDASGWLGLTSLNLLFGGCLLIGVLGQIALLERAGFRLTRLRLVVLLTPLPALAGLLL